MPIASIIPPPQRSSPVPALRQINSLRLWHRSTWTSTGAQNRPITRITPTAVIALITTRAVIRLLSFDQNMSTGNNLQYTA